MQIKHFKKFALRGTSLVVQWLRLHGPSAGALGLTPGQGAPCIVKDNRGAQTLALMRRDESVSDRNNVTCKTDQICWERQVQRGNPERSDRIADARDTNSHKKRKQFREMGS